MTLILSTYVLQDIVSLESPWISKFSTVLELNEWILCFWLKSHPVFDPYNMPGKPS